MSKLPALFRIHLIGKLLIPYLHMVEGLNFLEEDTGA